ncbi:MAG: hypothetical protein Q8K36_06440 [Alphaproteobacteria bacterium]|nr:hypothetical protein [Alphaproteobacteria bacterium]
MFLKVLMLCVFSMGSVTCSDVSNKSPISQAAPNPSLDDLRAMEKDLQSVDAKDSSGDVESVLRFCHENGMTYQQIAEKFNSTESLVQRFLAKETPAFVLVGNVHQYYVDGNPSLVSMMRKEDSPSSSWAWAFDWFTCVRGLDVVSKESATTKGAVFTGEKFSSGLIFPHDAAADQQSDTHSSEGEPLLNHSVSSDESEVDAVLFKGSSAHPPKAQNEGLRRRKPHPLEREHKE